MTYLVIRHKVKDYAKWKAVFDENASFRKTNGSMGGYLYRNIDNPNETIIIFEWNSLEKARKFAESEDLRQAMNRAGVVDKPDIYYLEGVEQISV